MFHRLTIQGQCLHDPPTLRSPTSSRWKRSTRGIPLSMSLLVHAEVREGYFEPLYGPIFFPIASNISGFFLCKVKCHFLPKVILVTILVPTGRRVFKLDRQAGKLPGVLYVYIFTHQLLCNFRIFLHRA